MNSPTRSYSSPEVCKMVGCTYRQLDYWTRIGLVFPSEADGFGSGNRRRWTRTDIARVHRVHLASRLCGLTLHEALERLDDLAADVYDEVHRTPLATAV